MPTSTNPDLILSTLIVLAGRQAGGLATPQQALAAALQLSVQGLDVLEAEEAQQEVEEPVQEEAEEVPVGREEQKGFPTNIGSSLSASGTTGHGQVEPDERVDVNDPNMGRIPLHRRQMYQKPNWAAGAGGLADEFRTGYRHPNTGRLVPREQEPETPDEYQQQPHSDKPEDQKALSSLNQLSGGSLAGQSYLGGRVPKSPLVGRSKLLALYKGMGPNLSIDKLRTVQMRDELRQLGREPGRNAYVTYREPKTAEEAFKQRREGEHDSGSWPESDDSNRLGEKGANLDQYVPDEPLLDLPPNPEANPDSAYLHSPEGRARLRREREDYSREVWHQQRGNIDHKPERSNH
jgi:hypothetical protein